MSKSIEGPLAVCSRQRMEASGLRALMLVLWLVAGLVPSLAVSAVIEVSLSQNPVPLGESFSLRFSSDREPSGDPDFSPLSQQFEILNQRRSSQFSFQNGHMQRAYLFEVELIAKTAGKIEIPPIAFGADRSNPFSVTITHGAVAQKRPGESELFLEVEASPKNPYVSQEVVLSVRVLSRVSFSGDLAQPALDGLNLSKLNGDRQFSALRGGAQYRVNERRYVFFPNQSGTLVIPPVNLTAELRDPAGPDPFSVRPRQQRFHSEPVALEVRPIPAAFKGKVWLPLRKLEIEEDWQPKAFEVAQGDPLTRSLTVKAEGGTQGMIPDVLGESGAIAGVQQYADQPELSEILGSEGLASQRKEKRAYIASGSDFEVPAVAVPWWNTKTDRMEVALLPGRMVKVRPGTSAMPVPGPFQAPGLPSSQTPEGVAGLASVPAASEAPTEGASPWNAAGVWQAATGVFLLLWIATLGLWLNARQGAKGQTDASLTRPEKGPGERPAPAGAQALEAAIRDQAWQRAHQILSNWGQSQWPLETGLPLEDQLDASLGAPYQALKRSLYAPGHAGFAEGEALVLAFKKACASAPRSAGRKASGREDPALEPLYRS